MQQSPELICSQLGKKFTAFYEFRMFITGFTSARHLYIYWATSIQLIPQHPTSRTSIFLLFFHLCLGLQSGHFLSCFPVKNNSTLPNMRYVPRPPHASRFDLPNVIVWAVHNIYTKYDYKYHWNSNVLPSVTLIATTSAHHKWLLELHFSYV